MAFKARGRACPRGLARMNVSNAEMTFRKQGVMRSPA